MDPDLPLLEALLAGEKSALDELIHRHREPLFRFAFRYLHDETAAHDIVQETFVRTWFKAPTYRPKSTVKTWIYAITLNLCRDRARRNARRRHLASGGDADSPVLRPAEVPDPAPGPAEAAHRSERVRHLQQAIDNLPHRLKSALILTALEGRTHLQAAEILATTPKTIEMRVRRAKVRLRKTLRDLL